MGTGHAVIVNFVFPSFRRRVGGVVVLYELANALSRRGHQVHFTHGPAWEGRIESLDELPPFRFEPSVRHRLADRLDDPRLPAGDVAFYPDAPARLGLPVGVVQGYGLLTEEAEHGLYRLRGPKVCVARWLVEVGRSLGVPDAQLWHVPLGMDHGLFTNRVGHGERPYDVAMLYHSHVEKGADVGLAAIELVRRRRPDLRAVVFGAERPWGALPGGVDFVYGADQEALVERVYNATRVFVQPSRREGFGYTAVEAMACGAALVTTDNGGSRDYAEPDRTAVVVPPEDPQALADAVLALIDDEPRRLALAAAGEAAVRRFDWDRSGELLEAHLLRYLDDPAAYRQPVRPVAEPDATT